MYVPICQKAIWKCLPSDLLLLLTDWQADICVHTPWQKSWKMVNTYFCSHCCLQKESRNICWQYFTFLSGGYVQSCLLASRSVGGGERSIPCLWVPDICTQGCVNFWVRKWVKTLFHPRISNIILHHWVCAEPDSKHRWGGQGETATAGEIHACWKKSKRE